MSIETFWSSGIGAVADASRKLKLCILFCLQSIKFNVFHQDNFHTDKNIGGRNEETATYEDTLVFKNK